MPVLALFSAHRKAFKKLILQLLLIYAILAHGALSSARQRLPYTLGNVCPLLPRWNKGLIISTTSPDVFRANLFLSGLK